MSYQRSPQGFENQDGLTRGLQQMELVRSVHRHESAANSDDLSKSKASEASRTISGEHGTSERTISLPAANTYQETMAKVSPSEANAEELDNYSSDTEDEVDIVKLLEIKGKKDIEAGQYMAAERVFSKVLGRLRKLYVRRSSFQKHIIDTTLKIAYAQVKQQKWSEAGQLLEKTIVEFPDMVGKEVEKLQFFSLQAQVLIEIRDLGKEQAACTKLMKHCRKLYGKTDRRYYAALVFMIRVLWLQGEEDDAEAYLSVLPEDFRAHAIVHMKEREEGGLLSDASLLNDGGIRGETREGKVAIPAPNSGPFNISDQVLRQIWSTARSGSLIEFKKLVSQYEHSMPQLLQIRNECGNTLLGMAITNGQLPLAMVLVEQGASLDEECQSKNTALHYAVNFGYPDIVRILLSEGATVNVANDIGITPLHLAASIGDCHIGLMLLAKGADVLTKDWEGETPLHKTACEKHTEFVKLLLSRSHQFETSQSTFNRQSELVGVRNRAETSALGLTSIPEIITEIYKYL